MLPDLRLPVELSTRVGDVAVRRATASDLPALIALLSDDPISAARGDRAADGDAAAYQEALTGVLDAPLNDLLVVDAADGTVVGTLQLTVIPGMARRGATRLLVEAVRVSSRVRSSGIGGAVMRWVMHEAASDTGATLVQLTSDAARVDAHRFYTRLGFADSHIGFKYTVGR
ncbi:Ribosomal protein S18 acetylase RimI [Microbacterium sp. ru370.1]|uniref:GNAT family N-acetyltransferase n=1 Tax=unclassified Microbacterium TaxID=2609290 RepID=UPI000882AA78|nr:MULTISPECIES: GNAT family N-acetyltransferase [unclassified Microbacterium]SDO79203.1 Ribosomal protein S18 acetylase RimI [Microbacterium sp. ru370.1]SIT89401.1 Ribosomal protein S18 acetylase RimI [Microbacterium sp. RU1D]